MAASHIIVGLVSFVGGFGTGFPFGYFCGESAACKRMARNGLLLRGLNPDDKAVAAVAKEECRKGGVVDKAAEELVKKGGLRNVTVLDSKESKEVILAEVITPRPLCEPQPA